LVGGGENRTLVLSKLYKDHYMLSALELDCPRCRARHYG